MSIKSYLRLMRLPNGIMIGIAVIIGEIIGSLEKLVFEYIILGFITGFLLCSSIMIFNDYFDIEVDKINAPHRPLVSGQANIHTALNLAVIYGFIAIILSLFLTIYNFLISCIFWILGILYNWKIKRTGFYGNIIVSASVAIPFIYGSLVYGVLNVLILIFSLMAFLSNISRELIKNIADVEGDKVKGIKTLAVTKGISLTVKVATLFTLAAVSLSLLPIYFKIVNTYYIPFVIISDLFFIYSICRLYKHQDKDEALISKNRFLYAMLLGLFSFIIGTI